MTEGGERSLSELNLNDENIESMERRRIVEGSMNVWRPSCMAAYRVEEGNEGYETTFDAQWRCSYQMIHHAT